MRIGLLLCAVAAAVFAQSYTIREVAATPAGGKVQLGITFNKSVSTADQATIQAKKNWSVFKYPKGVTEPVRVEMDGDPQFVPDDSVVLVVAPVAGEQVTRWVAVLNAFNFPSGSTAAAAAPASGGKPFSAASTRKETAIYLSGALAAAQRSRPQYAIDAAIAVFKDMGRAGAIGIDAAMLANQGPEVDPDSIRAALAYRKLIPFFNKQGDATGAGLIFNLTGAGGEFNRGSVDARRVREKPQVSNFMYGSPVATLLLPRWKAAKKLRLEPEFLGGVELGRRMETLPGFKEDLQIARGLLGTNLYFYTDPGSTPRRLLLTGQYRLRKPFTNEPYGFRDGAGVFQLVMDQRSRSYVGADLEYVLTPGLALGVKYKWGSLPPLFPKITHQVSIGVSILVKQAGSGNN